MTGCPLCFGLRIERMAGFAIEIRGAEEAAKKKRPSSKMNKKHASGAEARIDFTATFGTLRLRSGQAIKVVP